MRGDISRGSVMSKFWVSGCSSPMPRAPLAAQRSISVTASCPQAGLTEQKGMRRPLAGGCGVGGCSRWPRGLSFKLVQPRPKGDGDVDVRFVHCLEQLGGGGGFGLGIAEQKSEGLVLTR